VRSTPIFCDPARNSVVFTPDVAETVFPEDLVIRPGRFAIGAPNANGFTFAYKVQELRNL
jgi:hypothetical protein